MTRILLPVTLITFAAAGPLHAADDLPNIVLIFSDDQGYNDVSAYGSEIPTPYIDSIAEGGVKFTDGYVSAPACTPSRYSLLTGRLPNRAKNGLHRVQMPGTDGRLGPGETTLAALLKEQGYRTGIIGKWHLGHDEPERLPTRHGFDYFLGHELGCTDYFRFQYAELDDWYRNEEHIRPNGYATDVLTDEAVRFIEESPADEPFFLYLPYNAPHYGKGWDPEKEERLNILQAKEEDIAAFERIEDEDRRVYAAMVKAMDDGIGRVLETLQREGIEEETWVIFISDNGGDYGYGGSNKPLRGAKRDLWEGGIRVPFVMRWPGRIEAGRVIDQPVSTLDFVPTLCGMLGIDTAGRTLDGIDLSPVIFYDERVDRDLFWASRGQEAFRRGPWKFYRTRDDEPMLFNLDRDLAEENDLAEEHPEKLKELIENHAAVKATFN